MDIREIEEKNALLTDGVWVGDLPNFGDVRLKVRPMNSPKVVRALGKMSRSVPMDQRNVDGSIPDDMDDEIVRTLLVEHVLLGWENITKGKRTVRFSIDQARQWILNDVFESAVRTAALKAAQIVDDQIEALAKN